MASVERRGKYYRGRYRNPPGVVPRWGTVSEKDGLPFTLKSDARDAAHDKEAEIRALVAKWEGPPAEGPMTLDEWKRALAGRLRARGERDVYSGEVTLREWVETKWLPAQNLEDSSETAYRQHLNRRIYPRFGSKPVNSLFDPQEIDIWEKKLLRRYAVNTATNTRNLLATILDDARVAGLVDVNAAARRRRRGKVADRRLADGGADRANKWITPLQAFLLAERTAALTGSDQDFIMWTTCAWCALRWGEVMAVRRQSLLASALVVDAQLSPPDGPFRLRPPKDASVRDNSLFGAVDLPPFLEQLLALQMAAKPPARCNCAPSCGGTGYLFLTEDGGHPLHGTYSDFPWTPAAHGLTVVRRARPGRSQASDQRPVLVDVSGPFPGRQLSPAWPVAVGDQWEPPAGKGMVRHDLPAVDALAVDCLSCPAPAGQRCVSETGKRGHTHRLRVHAARERGHVHQAVLASWLPIRPGFTPHGLRHSGRVWVDEVGTPDVLAHDRLGHAKPGIGGTYAHVSPLMREQLKAKLQQLWVTTLDQRLALSPTSSVPVVNRLLAARAAERKRAA